MTNDDRSKIDAILEIIARDDELCEQFARAIGEDVDEFNKWIDTIKIDKNL